MNANMNMYIYLYCKYMYIYIYLQCAVSENISTYACIHVYIACLHISFFASDIMNQTYMLYINDMDIVMICNLPLSV